MTDFEELRKLAKDAAPSSKKFYKKHRKHLESMDVEIHELHDKYSDEIDCLNCGNCCRTLGPRITDMDINKIAKHLRMKPSEFLLKYAKMDTDGDYAFKTMPCPFLMSDNYCQIYDARPKACKDYPHTDQKKVYQVFELSIENAYTCPIPYNIIEDLKKKYAHELKNSQYR